jgi:DNA-binding CsgD family transcriptional regulator
MLDDARGAWSSGDFIRCLALLDDFGVPQPGTGSWVEATLLRARSLYRLKRYPETIALLEPVLTTFADGDEACTAFMLFGSSIARSGDVDRGLEILEATAANADAARVHRAIRAEIAHARALAHWTRRELEETERLARRAESAGADIISVRATQLRGFVALAQQRFREALALFNATLDAYWQCRQRDSDLAEMTVFEITALELMLRSRSVSGTHRVPERRRARDPWETPPPVASVVAMQISAGDAWLFSLDGDRDAAFRKMRTAEDMAPAPAWRVWALAGRAFLAAAFGEPGSAREHAAVATEIAHTVDWNATTGEERVALLLLAEVLTAVEPPAATAVLKMYDALPRPMDPGQAMSGDPRLRAFEDFVRGLEVRSRGDHTSAMRLLTSAASRYAACGNLWRAVLARIELASTSQDTSELEAARAIVAEHFPSSFLAGRVGIQALSDPVVARLTPAQRDVLALLLDGLNAREIATKTGRAYNTVRVHIDRLREAFGASSIHAMVVDCHRRGIVLPSARGSQGAKDEPVRNCG